MHDLYVLGVGERMQVVPVLSYSIKCKSRPDELELQELFVDSDRHKDDRCLYKDTQKE
jgi:hypothetical protein